MQGVINGNAVCAPFSWLKDPDQDTTKEAVRADWRNLEFVKPEWKTADVIIDALKQDLNCLKFVEPEQQTRDVINYVLHRCDARALSHIKTLTEDDCVVAMSKLMDTPDFDFPMATQGFSLWRCLPDYCKTPSLKRRYLQEMPAMVTDLIDEFWDDVPETITTLNKEFGLIVLAKLKNPSRLTAEIVSQMDIDDHISDKWEQIDGYEAGQTVIRLATIVKELHERNLELERENLELTYQPGGPGYDNAKDHFEELSNRQACNKD